MNFNKLRPFLIFLLFVQSKSLLAQNKWNLDKTHSSVNFSVSHMVVSEVVGKFTSFDGKISSSKEDFMDAQIKFEIDAKSIDTGDPKRDDHLRDKDFFNVNQYPKIIFESTKIKKLSKRKYKLMGYLTLHGTKKRIQWDVKYKGIVDHPRGGRVAGFKCETTINRQDYGIKWSKSLDKGGLMVGNDVDIVVNIELSSK